MRVVLGIWAAGPQGIEGSQMRPLQLLFCVSLLCLRFGVSGRGALLGRPGPCAHPSAWGLHAGWRGREARPHGGQDAFWCLGQESGFGCGWIQP